MAERTYTTAERRAFRAPACQKCGRRLTADWIDVTTTITEDPFGAHLLHLRCGNIGCPDGPTVS